MSSLDPKHLKRNAENVVDPVMDKIGRALGVELGRRLIRATPVDTGRARSNWNTSLESPDATTTDAKVKSGAPAFNALNRTTSAFKISDGDVMYLTNGLPYIERLNDGYSAQAGKRFIEAAVLQVEALVPRIAKRFRHRG